MSNVNPNFTHLDQQQILQRVFDGGEDKLRVDADLKVDSISGELLVEIRASDGDNIAITNQDGTNPLKINADGSINVSIATSGGSSLTNTYNEVTSIPSSILTTILNTTLSQSGKLALTEISGTNIAEFTIEINSFIIAKVRTYFGSSLNHEFDFQEGILLNSGDNIKVRVIHYRPDLGDFNARIGII